MPTILREGKIQGGTLPNRLLLTSGELLVLNSGRYEVGKKYGEGGFGSVYRVEDKDKHMVYAMKILNLWKMKHSDYNEMSEMFLKGFEIGNINSPFLVKNFYKGTLKGNPYIILGNCPNGNLKSRLSDFRSVKSYKRIAQSILLGLKSLHENGLLHRDLKPENILFDKNDDLKLSDFDTAGLLKNNFPKTSLKGSSSTTRNGLNSLLSKKLFKVSNSIDMLVGKSNLGSILGGNEVLWGTPEYAPPEQLDNLLSYKYQGATLDIFSFGVTMYELISGGRLPFGSLKYHDNNFQKLRRAVLNKENYKPLTSIIKNLDSKWNNMIECCLESNPVKRFQNVDEILSFLDLESSIQRSVMINAVGKPILQSKSVFDFNKNYFLSNLIQSKKVKSIIIGRANKEVDILIKNDINNYVSGRHCTISFRSKKWFIQDGTYFKNESEATFKTSTNGTYLNGERLKGENLYELSPGDLIVFGEQTFMFNYE